jgi:hypothetical protein
MRGSAHSAGWRCAHLLLAAVLTAGALGSPEFTHPVRAAAAPPAAPKPWEGRYTLTTYASQKAGTSHASQQREADFSAVFTLTTACSFDRCVATAVQETATEQPAPNPTVPTPARYAWNGTGWVSSYDWLWECTLGSAAQNPAGPTLWAKATSFALYAPQPDGSLRGTWHTDISEGPCRGTVLMPVAAFPA